MGAEVLFNLLKIVIKVGFWASVIIVFIVLVTLVTSSILVVLNGSVLMDLFYITQLWLPFNLNVILTWTVTLTLAYFVYRVAMWAFIFIGELLRS